MNRILPILFNTDMVRAILEKRKSATRRGIKKSQCMLMDKKSPFELKKEVKYDPWCTMSDAEYVAATYKTPYNPGDILYVRETWCHANKEGIEPDYYYYADTFMCEDYDETEWKWRPSIHMPKDAARIWLRVTDVRVKRLQDMTLDDFLNEGVVIRPESFNDSKNAYQQAKEVFRALWDSTIRKPEFKSYGWNANPWVWVIRFERLEKTAGGF